MGRIVIYGWPLTSADLMLICYTFLSLIFLYAAFYLTNS